MLGFDVCPQHTWGVLETLLGINDRDQELVCMTRATHNPTKLPPTKNGVSCVQMMLGSEQKIQ